MRFAPKTLCALGMLLAAGCRPKQDGPHFYEQHIQPIFNNFCTGNTSPCHKVETAGTGLALGNLDLTSFENVQKRRDVLRTYGSYPQPLLLLKALPEETVLIPYQGRLLPSEIRHAGGKPIAPSSDAYYELKRWLDNGANRDGIAPSPQANHGLGPCVPAVPAGYLGLPATVRSSQKYQDFVANVQPKMLESCAYATCHSSPQADFHLTCAADDVQTDWNFQEAVGFVVLMPTNVQQSEILLRPLAPAAGGVSHTGGVYFPSREDINWKAWRDWALEVQADPLAAVAKSAGQQFFEDNVMPKLLQRGCALEGCHSPDGFNDFRLRSGAQGFFAPEVLVRNHDTTLKEFMALDTVDVRQSRAVKKTIFAQSGGITHRAGPLLEDAAALTDACPAPFDPQATDNRAFCIFKEWHRIERQAAGTAVSPMTVGSTLPVALIARPQDPDNLLQFDTYRGGADLKLGTATLDANGGVTSIALTGSGLTNCSGLAGQDVDVRGPEWSYDASQLIFAARAGAASGLDLWLLDVAGGTCRRLTSDNGRLVNNTNVHVHNFDPVFAPDGSVVFASTRVGTLTLKNGWPNSDLFRVGSDLKFTNPDPEQMTFLLNSEIGPAFMQDGRVSFTAEKATPDFYQLSGRRINWDLTDYHPLLAQRAMSTDTHDPTLHPSINYQQATEIREGLDRNFLIILSDATALGGGGALATFNRSIGPFQADRTEVTFVKSVVIVDQAATGKDGTAGVYRSPFSLPNGEILASYAAGVTHPATDVPHYALVAVDPGTGARRMLASDASLSYVEAVVGYKRAETDLFRNLPQLVFGGRTGGAADDTGVMHFPDLPLLGTLLGANLRHGRYTAPLDGATALRVYEEKPPPANFTGSATAYSDRMPLGNANLAGDASLKVNVPARRPLILELIDAGGKSLFTMTEEHQVGPGEYVTPGAPRKLFNGICGGCHGSISGEELDVAVTADSLTGASASASRDQLPVDLK